MRRRQRRVDPVGQTLQGRRWRRFELSQRFLLKLFVQQVVDVGFGVGVATAFLFAIGQDDDGTRRFEVLQ